MRRSIIHLGTMLVLVLVLGPISAIAGDADYRAGFDQGRKFAELERRVAELEKMLAECKSGKPSAAIETVTTLAPVKIPEEPIVVPPPKAQIGQVAGSVRMPQGESRVAAFVYLDDVNAPLVKDKTEKIEQVNRQFYPRFMAVQKGTRIEFPNRDAIYHNVFSLSLGNRFDVGSSRSGDIASGHRFVTPGIADIYCNRHGQMSAMVLVVPNDRYVRVKADGTFVLDKIPPGLRKIALVTEDGRRVVQEVNVSSGRAEVIFDLPIAEEKPPHLDKFGRVVQ